MNPNLPNEEDFGGGPDARSAWGNFGGKTLEEAYEQFCAYLSSSSENFMWMGERAFRYYFPVLDRYMRNLSPIDRSMDVMWVEAYTIGFHFDCHEDMSGLHESIIALCDYVVEHLSHFAPEPDEQRKVANHWAALRRQVADDARRIREPTEPRG